MTYSDGENASIVEDEQKNTAAKRESVEKWSEVYGFKPVVVEDAAGVKGLDAYKNGDAVTKARMLRSPGWFDPKTGEITIVLGNNRDADDVAATMFHEKVAHSGLRELVGEDNYTDFLHEVYEHCNKATRNKIAEKAAKHGWDFEKATDEYLGDLSEKGFEDFDEGDRSIWSKLKDIVLKAIDKFLGTLKLPDWLKLGDNELRYMLWRSHENLRRGKENVIEQAQDIVKRNDLGLGESLNFKMGDAADTFAERQKQAEANKGTVMPGLNEAEVKVVNAEPHSFKTFAEAEQWADENIVKEYNDEETGGKGEIRISKAAVKKYLSESAVSKSASKDVHLAVLKVLPDIIRESIEAEEHADYSKSDGERNSVNAVNKDVLVHRLYGAVGADGNLYRVKVTMKEYLDANKPSKPHSYEATKIEVLAGTLEGTDSIFPNTSTSDDVGSTPSKSNEVLYPLAKLLQNVEKSYDSGKNLLIESKILDESNLGGTRQSSSELGSALAGTSFDESGDLLFRDGDDSLKDIMLDGSLSLRERTTAAAMNMSLRHEEDKMLRQDAFGEVVRNLQELAHELRNQSGRTSRHKGTDAKVERGVEAAAKAQRVYDRTTVKRVSDFARILAGSGLLSNLTQGEVKRLLAAVRNSAGSEDITKSVDDLMGLLVDNQLSHAKEVLHKLETVKGSKVDAKGVEVQGTLDPAGASVLRTFKKHCELSVGELEGYTDKDGVYHDGLIEQAQERMNSEDNAIAENAANEYAGLSLALDYARDIGESKKEEKELRQSITDAETEKKEGRMSADAFRQFKEETQDAIRQNRIERVEAYYRLAGRLSGSLRESIANAERFKEAEQERIRQIWHYANSDMEGRPNEEHRKESGMDRAANLMASTLLNPLMTFEQMMRMFGSKSTDGEGYLYNHFVRGQIDARGNEIEGVRSKFKALDEKVSEIFGGKAKGMGDLIRMERTMPKATVSFWNGGEMQERELSQGNMLYIYMVNKMTDGRMKLRRMGITEEDVAGITEAIDPRFIQLADWIQDEFLVGTRNEYNETHKRMFGASMASIEHYFPLKILKDARNVQEDIDAQDNIEGGATSTVTGAIKKRVRNSVALDVTNADALSVVLDHIAEMEHWNAFAEWGRDMNTLLSYRRFRNQVKNMRTVYGAGDKLWSNFKTVCRIAAGTYHPDTPDFDKGFLALARGVTAAKVSFRINTALKQLLSAPAYIPELSAEGLAECIRHPENPWKWCMENLPVFKERWEGRMSGDPRLKKSDMGWNDWRNNIVEIAARWGMTPNAFVDALTVSIGAYGMYQSKMKRYLADGYGKDEADNRAKQDATILFNLTQQSSEGAFLSPMQANKNWLSTMFTVFRNSPMSYTRQVYDASRNLKRNLTPSQRAKTVAFMKKQMERDGVDPDMAEKAAKGKLNRQIRKDLLRELTFGFILPGLWSLGGYWLYLLAGSDDEEKDRMADDVKARLLTAPFEGLTGGDVLSNLAAAAVTGEWSESTLAKDMPVSGDAASMMKKFLAGRTAEGVNDIVNIVAQMSVGVNPQTLENAVLGIIDACGNDVELSHEAAILAARILNNPESQIKKLYFDEIGLSGEEASKLTPQQIAERYARMQVMRGRPLAPWLWDDEEAIAKQVNGRYGADALVKERVARLGGKEANDTYNAYVEGEEYKRQKELEERYKAAMKEDYVKAAEIAAEQDADPESYNRYLDFKAMKKGLGAMVKAYLGAKTAEEAALCRKAVEDYKAAMPAVMNGGGDEAWKRLDTICDGFYKEWDAMQPE